VPYAFLSRLSPGCIAAAFCAAAIGGSASQPVSDEPLRLAALTAIFPKTQVSIDRGKRIDNSWPAKPEPGELSFFAPDTLKDETVYRVIGKARNQAETEASQDIVTRRSSNTRQVRFRLFRWPNENAAGLLAVLQYDFSGANPAMSCPSLGLLVRLVRNSSAKWELRDEYLLETVHHSSLQRIELLDLTRDGVDDLVIESDFGGAGTRGSNLQVFDLSHARFDELLHTNSRLQYIDQDYYKQVLDTGRTLQSHGQRFCFSKTILIEKGKWFRPPRVARPCYKRGDGIDAWQAEYRKIMLAPPR
jgi:hypothetical protein